jgi:NAD(P)-dependent dehydrogenase (short-subunit alcohol dehydrogenase family)
VGLATTKVITSASEDFHVIIASRSLEKAKNAKSEIEAAGTKGSLSTVQLDVTDEHSIQQALALVQQEFGRLDVLVNNAGIYISDPNVRNRFQLTMEANVVGPAATSAAFRPLLLKSPKPYSIYVSSNLGSMSEASNPNSRTRNVSADAYRASKAAVNMIALQESIEFSSSALKVYAVCPGYVRSNLRGTSEEARSGGGLAGDPSDSGEMILGIIQGKRDADAGKFVHKDGVYPW